jgi:hypothetical protein
MALAKVKGGSETTKTKEDKGGEVDSGHAVGCPFIQASVGDETMKGSMGVGRRNVAELEAQFSCSLKVHLSREVSV